MTKIIDNIAKYRGVGLGLYLLISLFNDNKNIKNKTLHTYSFLLALPLKENRFRINRL
jgi:hypothetical protein